MEGKDGYALVKDRPCSGLRESVGRESIGIAERLVKKKVCILFAARPSIARSITLKPHPGVGRSKSAVASTFASTIGIVAGLTGFLALIVRPSGSEKRDGFTLYKFSRVKMSSADDVPFPSDFSPQRIRLANAHELADQPPAEIVKYFEANPERAMDVIGESADKRFMPTTFIERRPDGYRVGWLSNCRMQRVQVLTNKADAVTDYLLFSLGKGRWNGRSSER